MVLNKLSKAARGKSNKVHENAASLSKMPLRTSLCPKYLKPKSLILLNFFKFNRKQVI